MTTPAAVDRERPPPARAAGARFAALVALGILFSRVAGLVRTSIFTHFLGTSAAADAFNAAFRIPNFLQNLFGEGVLSASFIPVYARLLARDDGETASRVAGAVLSMLALVTAVLVLAGVLATPWIIDVIAPGFEGEKRLLTIRLVRILFPGAGLLVLSAWALGVLNSHRRFLLSYAAPVVWNAAIIAGLLLYGWRVGPFELVVIVAWASVLGSALQVAVQLPTVRRVLPRMRARLEFASTHVRTVVRNFVPVFVGRGVVQVSAYIDTILASLLPTGAVAALFYAQQLYTLPVSLFGMSVSAAELPEMASAIGRGGDGREVAAHLRSRLDDGLRRIAFFVIPSAVAFVTIGDVLVAALYMRGVFTPADTLYVWSILAAAAVGLLATTLGRLYASTYYALHDTRTPLRVAVVRVALTAALGYPFALHLPELIGVAPRWGAAGIALSSGLAGWVEFVLLRRALRGRIGRTGIAAGFLLRVWSAAAVAAIAAWGVRLLVGRIHPILFGLIVALAFGVAYFATAAALGVREGRDVLAHLPTLASRLGGRRGR